MIKWSGITLSFLFLYKRATGFKPGLLARSLISKGKLEKKDQVIPGIYNCGHLIVSQEKEREDNYAHILRCHHLIQHMSVDS